MNIKDEEENNEEDQDDVSFTEEDETQSDKIKKLREKLKKCEEERREFLAGWQKAKADFVNMRRRDEEEKKDFAKFALSGFFEELIAVLDSFDMALEHPGFKEGSSDDWRKGILNIYSQTVKLLEKHGLTSFEAKGVVFNPEEHEAVGVLPVDDESQDGVAVEVFQKGYKLNGKILRTAKVKVGEFNAGK